MCTSGIYHTSNGYYSAVMATRTIFCLIQWRDEPAEAYSKRFEAAISTTELENCNTTNHMELNKAYADGDIEDVTNRFQSMYLIMSADSYWYSGIWNKRNNITLLFKYNYPKSTTFAYDVLCRYKKPTPPRQVGAPPEAVTFIQIGDTEKNKTVPGNDGRSFP